MNYQAYYALIWLLIVALVAGIFAVNNAVAMYRFRLANDATVQQQCRQQLAVLSGTRWILWTLAIVLGATVLTAWYRDARAKEMAIQENRARLMPVYERDKIWEAPDLYLAQTDEHAKQIAYGRDLVAHTEDYFGANGIVKPASTNGMNCQNCHLDAGSKPYGNNYFAVSSTYPQMRVRSGALETIPKRVNDCFQRSLNGAALDTTSREMQAIVAYIQWLGTGIPKGEKPVGAGLVEVPFLDRAADPAKGQAVCAAKCASCHGADGQGLPIGDGARRYPPLWGDKSYNQGAGLYRLSRFAGYVKTSMPFGASYQSPQLSDEEAWDVAAFVNTQPRPKHPFLDTDWPKMEKKTFDHPFGPYADTFPESQHKYGPFGPIIAFYKK